MSSRTWPISRRSAPSIGANSADGRPAEERRADAFAFRRGFGRADFLGDAFFSTRLGAAVRFAGDFLTGRLAMVSSSSLVSLDVRAIIRALARSQNLEVRFCRAPGTDGRQLDDGVPALPWNIPRMSGVCIGDRFADLISGAPAAHVGRQVSCLFPSLKAAQS